MDLCDSPESPLQRELIVLHQNLHEAPPPRLRACAKLNSFHSRNTCQHTAFTPSQSIPAIHAANQQVSLSAVMFSLSHHPTHPTHTQTICEERSKTSAERSKWELLHSPSVIQLTWKLRYPHSVQRGEGEDEEVRCGPKPLVPAF